MTGLRRPAVLAVAAAAVVLGALALRPLLPQPPDGPVDPAPSDTARGLASVVDVAFTDAGTGYAALRECALPVTGPESCGWSLATARDGATWERRPAPVASGVEDVELVALPGGVLVLADDDDRPATGWFSPDDGATWTTPDTLPDEGVAEVPDGAVLRQACLDEACGLVDPVAVLPSDGRHVALPALPALGSPQAVPGVDGALVLTGVLPGTGGPAVATSRDRGRSWTVAALGPATPAWTVTVGGSASVLHAAVNRYGVTGDPQGAELLTSVDGGATWSPGAGGLPASDLAVGPDGRVVLAPLATGRLLVSTDGGRSVEPLALPYPLEAVRRSGSGYVGSSLAGWRRSVDGTTWDLLDPVS